MSRVHAAAARILATSFGADSHAAFWVSNGGGPSSAVTVQMERAPYDGDMVLSTPVRSSRIYGAILAGALPFDLAEDDTLIFPDGTTYAGEWRVDGFPSTRGDDDPAGLLVRFEACPQ
jgi:hypothetical protein